MKRAIKILMVAAFALGVASAQANDDEVSEAGVGYYSANQVEQGERIYAQNCASCHGSEPASGSASAPPLAGLPFMFYWEDYSAYDLFLYTKENMPQDRPDSLSDAEYIDLTALLLFANDFPAGEGELPSTEEELREISLNLDDEEAAD